MIEDGSKLFLTPEEVAERYQGKVTARTLANWRSQGISPPYTKVGGRILYPLRELIEWEKRRTVNSTSCYAKLAALIAVPLVSWRPIIEQAAGTF